MREGAAERAAMPDLPIADARRGHGQQRRELCDERRRGHLVMRRHRADDERVTVVADAVQLRHAAEVDEQARRREPQPQHRQQALPAGDHLRLVARLGQRRDRVVHSGRTQVVECDRDHDTPPWCAWIARHTRSGVHGMAMSLTP